MKNCSDLHLTILFFNVLFWPVIPSGLKCQEYSDILEESNLFWENDCLKWTEIGLLAIFFFQFELFSGIKHNALLS